MKVLFIINDAPYKTDKMYNAFRMALQLHKDHTHVEVRVFLMDDAVLGAIKGNSTPENSYNIENQITQIIEGKGYVKLCKGCIEKRLKPEQSLIAGAEISTMAVLTDWMLSSDKVLTF